MPHFEYKGWRHMSTKNNGPRFPEEKKKHEQHVRPKAPLTFSRNNIPEKVNLRHLRPSGPSPFHDEGTLKKIYAAYEQSLQTKQPLTKISRARGKKKDTLTQQERDLNLEYSVIFVKRENEVIPVTLYHGKKPEVKPTEYNHPNSAEPSEGEGFLLGEGGFGKVKLGWDETNQEWVAVKIQKMKADNETKIGMAQTEQKLSEKAGGSELSRGYLERDMEEKGTKKIYQVSKVLGKNLYSCLKADIHSKDRINSLSERLDIAIKMAQKLQEVHNQNIIHRDIKSDNFLYNKNNKEVTLIDFGLANDVNDKSNKSNIPGLGTPGYQAPEIKPNKSLYSKQSDIYALGVAYQDLFEFHETMGPNPGYPGAVFEDVQGHEPFPNQLEWKMLNLISQMVASKPEDRGNLPNIMESIRILKNEFNNSVLLNGIRTLQENDSTFLSSQFLKNYEAQQKKELGMYKIFRSKNPKTEQQLKTIRSLLEENNNPTAESIKRLYDGLESIKRDIDKSKDAGSTLGRIVDKMIKNLDSIKEFKQIHEQFASFKPVPKPRPKI